MSRRAATPLLLALLLLASGFTVWRLLAPYDSARDPAAAYEVKVVEVARDAGFRWLDIYLRPRPGSDREPPEAIRLLTAEGEPIPPAATGAIFRGGTPDPSEPDLRFWLEAEQLGQPLTLKIDQDRLRVKTTSAAPELSDGQTRTFRSARW